MSAYISGTSNSTIECTSKIISTSKIVSTSKIISTNRRCVYLVSCMLIATQVDKSNLKKVEEWYIRNI